MKQAVGIAGVTAGRLAKALGAPGDLDGVADVLSVHPLLLPRAYVAISLERIGDSLRVALLPCPATQEDDGLTWPALLTHTDGSRMIEVIAGTVAPQARVTGTETSPGELIAWNVVIDPGAEPYQKPSEVVLTEFSTGALFEFERRG